MQSTEVCEPAALKAQTVCKLITGLPRHFVSRKDGAGWHKHEEGVQNELL